MFLDAAATVVGFIIDSCFLLLLLILLLPFSWARRAFRRLDLPVAVLETLVAELVEEGGGAGELVGAAARDAARSLAGEVAALVTTDAVDRAGGVGLVVTADVLGSLEDAVLDTAVDLGGAGGLATWSKGWRNDRRAGTGTREVKAEIWRCRRFRPRG